MCEPKITKLKGGYSADVELVFCSWHADILIHIKDCKLDNTAAIELQTQDSTHEVEFHLNICGAGISIIRIC